MIILGIDQAAVSGWAVHSGLGGRIVVHGVARNWRERAAAIACAVEFAGGDVESVLVVLEDHSGIPLTAKTRFAGKAPTRNTASILGIGAARGRWDEALDRSGHPESKRIHVEPKDWRGRVLGLGEGASTELCKKTAIDWATATVFKTIADHNEAEAICIASWGALDGLSAWDAQRTRERAQARGRREVKRQKAFTWDGEP